MFWLVGTPVETVSALDSVEIALPSAAVVVAVTRTEVATVPPLTTVCAWPLTSVVADAGDSVMPPTVVLNAKVTVAPARGPPEVSSTLKITVEVAVDVPPVVVPVPLRLMLDGVAEMKEIEPTCAAATVTLPVAVRFWLFAAADAVMVSVPEQPVAT